MKVLVVSNMYPSKKSPSYGTFVATFVAQLKELNQGPVHLSVIRGRSKNRFIELWKYICFYVRTFSLALCGRYDIIYVHTITFPIIPLRLAACFRNLPLVFNVHGGDVLVAGGIAAKLKRMAVVLLNKALLIVVPSPYFKQIVGKEFPNINEHKIFVSPSGGIDQVFFAPPTCDVRSIPTFGFLSRIGEGKGWDTFLNAMAILGMDGVVYKAIIAGQGPQKQAMLGLLRERHLSDRVEYIDLEHVQHDDLPGIYRQMDVFVFPTYYRAESLGLVGIEAMASGVPVIGSDIGAVLSYLHDGDNGFVFHAGNAIDLASKLKLYLSLSDVQKKAMAQSAFQTALNYESGLVAQQLYAKLLSLVGRDS